MNKELSDALLNYEPTAEDAAEFWRSVREQEDKFSETTKKLTPTAEDRNRYFNM